MRKQHLQAKMIDMYGSQKGCASAIGLQQARLCRLLNGDKPTQRELEKLSSVFGLEFCYKLGQLARHENVEIEN